MSSAREPDYKERPDSGESPADRLARLRLEVRNVARLAESRGANRSSFRRRRRERAELEALRRAVSRWAAELDLLHEEHAAIASESGERERLENELRQKESELRALRGSAAERDLTLQREHATELQREREKNRELQQRLEAAESGGRREEEIREIKRASHERERELHRTHAERLRATEQEAQRRVSALQAQREADNRTLIQRHAEERATRDEQLHSLKLRRDAEARAYGERIEELAHDRTSERTSLEEAVAKLREKHEAERSRLQERIDELEELLREQEEITVELLEDLGYTRDSALPRPSSATEIEVSRDGSPEDVRRALHGLRQLSEPGNRLRAGLSLFNETEHLRVVGAICKSLGEPRIYAALQDHGGLYSPTLTFVWPTMGWRRYVTEPEESVPEPRVYLAGSGEDSAEAPVDGMQPNARLDAEGRLALGVRPL